MNIKRIISFQNRALDTIRKHYLHYVSNVKFILGNCSSRNKASMFGKTWYPLNRGTPDLDIKMNLSFDIILCYHLFHLIKISLHASLATLPLVRINWVTICHFKLLFLLPRKTKWEKKECYEGACLNKISLNPLIKYLYCGHAPPPLRPRSPSSFSFQIDTSKRDVASWFRITPSRTVPPLCLIIFSGRPARPCVSYGVFRWISLCGL